ncbi:hypothetical protein [Streptomyces poonensis]|uniref:hypothetical protein n=1 Tax=Streptomyces poonensis TaxID=68255 RepID=UPI0022F2F4A7|nr:hypothetical protein [Streptomyces poonensis]
MTLAWRGENVAVSSVERALPAQSAESAREAVTAAGVANPLASLPAGAWEAVARAAINPEAVAIMLRPTAQEPAGLLLEENVEGATLRTFNTRVWLSELLPGIQPRTGMEVMDISDPQVVGTIEKGEPCAVVRYRYRDFQHLKDHVRQTVHSTLALNSYAASILGRKVTRPLITHPVEFTFEDGTESFHALVVRDGITRLASAWAVLAGPEADAARAADLMVESLFGGVARGKVDGRTLSDRLAAVRETWRHALADEFHQAMAAEEPGDRGIHIAQTYVVPAQVAVGAEGHPGHLLAPEDVFDDAMRSILASVHVEFKAWDSAAQNVEVATRALKRVIQLGDAPVAKESLQVVYGLAVGRTAPENLPREYGDSQLPGTALWRGIQLVHALTRPELYERLKDQAKTIKGGSRMSAKGFAELLGPIIDLPWRSAKKAVSKQARNAWGNGGVLTRDVLKEWEPALTDDFTTLVEPAMAGRVDARCTLAVAGGIALIADKLLTRNVGSSLMAPKEKGGVPFRSDVHLVVENLSAEDNELGLWTLALTANRFRADLLPENAQSMRQFVRRNRKEEESSAYVHLKVDLAQPDKIARDENGVPVPLFEWDVVWASDQARASEAYAEHRLRQFPSPATSSDSGTDVKEEQPSGAGWGSTGGETTSAESKPSDTSFSGSGEGIPSSRRAADYRRTLRSNLESARIALDGLTEIDSTAGSWPPVIESTDFVDLRQSLLDLQTDLENLRRNIQGDDPTIPVESEDEDEG